MLKRKRGKKLVLDRIKEKVKRSYQDKKKSSFILIER